MESREEGELESDSKEVGSKEEGEFSYGSEEEGNADLTMEILSKAKKRQKSGGAAGPSGYMEYGLQGKDEYEEEEARSEEEEGEIPAHKSDNGDNDDGAKTNLTSSNVKRNKNPGSWEISRERSEDDVPVGERSGVSDKGNGFLKETDKAAMIANEGQQGEMGRDGGDEEGDADAVQAESDMKIRRLLRQPRYFDPPEAQGEMCYNCGERGHKARECTAPKKERPCQICSSFGHKDWECPEKTQCYTCGQSGHFARNCPNKGKGAAPLASSAAAAAAAGDVCMKCARAGHQWVDCDFGYPSADLRHLVCYVCEQPGHLSCADVSVPGPRQLSCFNCGERGHSGQDCPKPRRAAGPETDDRPGFTCYTCGEEGHMARMCPQIKQYQGPSSRDAMARSAPCYRCGEEGHMARNCTAGAAQGRGPWQGDPVWHQPIMGNGAFYLGSIMPWSNGGGRLDRWQAPGGGGGGGELLPGRWNQFRSPRGSGGADFGNMRRMGKTSDGRREERGEKHRGRQGDEVAAKKDSRKWRKRRGAELVQGGAGEDGVERNNGGKAKRGRKESSRRERHSREPSAGRSREQGGPRQHKRKQSANANEEQGLERKKSRKEKRLEARSKGSR